MTCHRRGDIRQKERECHKNTIIMTCHRGDIHRRDTVSRRVEIPRLEIIITDSLDFVGINSDNVRITCYYAGRQAYTSSEGERLVMEALVDSLHGRRRTVLQYIKMLSVIALPVAAVICLVSYTLHSSRVERAYPI